MPFEKGPPMEQANVKRYIEASCLEGVENEKEADGVMKDGQMIISSRCGSPCLCLP